MHRHQRLLWLSTRACAFVLTTPEQDVGSETKTEGKIKERHVFWRSQNHTSTGDTTRPHAKQKRTPSFFTRVFRFDFVAISYHHGSALQRPGARQHPEDEPRRGVGEQGPWKPLGRPPGGRGEGGPWNHLLRTGLSWAREGLAGPGSATLGCAGPTRPGWARPAPTGLRRGSR